MNLDGGDIVWAFDGRDGRVGGLRAMIGFYLTHLRELLPQGIDSDDQFEQIVAGLEDDPTNRMLSDTRLSRLFPPSLSDKEAADEFWRDSIHSQTRSRISAATVVLEDVDAWIGFVPVRLADVDAWAKTLGALRVFWYTELAGPERLAEPAKAAVDANPALADLIDWLGFLLEDLLESRSACLGADESLDPDQFTRSGH